MLLNKKFEKIIMCNKRLNNQSEFWELWKHNSIMGELWHYGIMDPENHNNNNNNNNSNSNP